MYGAMASLLDELDRMSDGPSPVIDWSCPVPFFGDICTARIATVGINPSNREFVDAQGMCLAPGQRRLPTLDSLGRSKWSEVDALQVRQVFDACRSYFSHNPYDNWFRTLDRVLGELPATYYGEAPTACHLDLVPFATATKWGDLTPSERASLMDSSRSAMAELLRDSGISVLILNGMSVVRQFEALSGTVLDSSERQEWSLPRRDGSAVKGIAYSGSIRLLGNVPLGREIRVSGYNHNLQSSFGVTSTAMSAISLWLAEDGERWAA